MITRGEFEAHKNDPNAHHGQGAGSGLDADMVDGKHANQLPLALSGAKAYLSASQTLASGTWIKINLDVKVWDLNNEFDTSSHRFTVSQAGYYLIVGVIWFRNLGTDVRGIVGVYKNGSAFEDIHQGFWAGGDLSMIINCTGVEYLVANDYLELWGRQESGTDKDVTKAFLWVFRLAL